MQSTEQEYHQTLGTNSRRWCRAVASSRACHIISGWFLSAKTTLGIQLNRSSFSDSWRSGEFPASFDNLHRYFDYTMQNRDRLFYQYALLNLGIVQSDFGC